MPTWLRILVLCLLLIGLSYHWYRVGIAYGRKRERNTGPYCYKIGYSSPEESYFFEVHHDSKFTEVELGDMVAEAVIALLPAGLKRRGCHGFGEIACEVRDWLLENKGFRFLSYEAEWSCFGWPSVFDNEDWGHERDDNLNRLTAAINSAGYGPEFDDYLGKGLSDITESRKQQLKAKVLEFFAQNVEADYYDLMTELDINLKLVVEICDELFEEGKIY